MTFKKKKGFFKSDKVIYLSLNRREAELSKPAVLGLARKISNCVTFHKTYFGAIFVFTINSEQTYKSIRRIIRIKLNKIRDSLIHLICLKAHVRVRRSHGIRNRP